MTTTAQRPDVATRRLDVARYTADVEALVGDALAVPPAVLAPAVLAWFGHRPHLEPLVVRTWRRDVVVGMATLAVSRRSGVRRVRQAGEPSEAWDVLLASPADADALAGEVADAVRGAGDRWTLRLSGLPAEGPVVGALERRLTGVRREDGPVVPRLDVASALRDSEVSTRNTRAGLAKARNRLVADHRALTLRWLRDPGEVDGALAAVTTLRAARNTQRAHPPALDPVEAATFRDTVRGHAEQGRARVLLAVVDDELAAFAVGVVTGDVLWVYANAVSPDFLRYSAGALANAELVRLAHRDPTVRWVDWGAGLQRYKRSGPVTLRFTTTLDAWSSPGVRWAQRLARAGHRLTARRRALPTPRS